MTNLEAFKVLLDDSAIPDQRISDILNVSGIDPNGSWVKSKSNPINCAFYDALINQVLKSANANTGIRSISEGGMSISYDSASPYLKARINGLVSDSGCSSLIDRYSMRPKIRDISHLLYRP
ncbi:DUF6706 family protein [Niabella aurantiaca]|uniref:DUF6706 family protein n=1 Tax=Niabella aurantiaca TaxID=379900 RepID=UPI00037FCC42|nr:DUF6706 family protein [Niabella aurantiaca]